MEGNEIPGFGHLGPHPGTAGEALRERASFYARLADYIDAHEDEAGYRLLFIRMQIDHETSTAQLKLMWDGLCVDCRIDIMRQLAEMQAGLPMSVLYMPGGNVAIYPSPMEVEDTVPESWRSDDNGTPPAE